MNDVWRLLRAAAGNAELPPQPIGTTWTTKSIAGGVSGWRAVIWVAELSKFVAVGINGTMYSTDGKNWIAGTPITNLYAVCWSPELNKFVATGYGVTAVSTDGINWVDRSITGNILGVCWSSQQMKFVATRYDSATDSALTSTDGINWTVAGSIYPALAYAWRSIAWSPTLQMYVAGGALGGIATSPDGSTWTLRLGARPTTDVKWIAELNMFVVGAQAGDYYDRPIMYVSTTGTSWSITNQGTYGNVAFAYVSSINRLYALRNMYSITADARAKSMAYYANTVAPTTSWNTSNLSGFNDKWYAMAYSPEVDRIVCVGDVASVLCTPP